MKILKICLFIITLSTLCFGVNAQEMQKIFDSKKPLYEKLTNDFPNYPNMDDFKKQEYEKEMLKLLEVEFLIKQFKIGGDTTKETYEIFSPYINFHSYFIARYLPYKKYIDASLLLMSGVMKYDPNDAYMETFVFLLACDGKFDPAFEFFPKFLEKYDDNDAKIDFDMIKDKALESAISTNNIELLQKLYDLKVDFNHFSNKEEIPPIFVAMYDKQREKSAKFLLEHGVDKNSTYKDEQILFNAVENHFSEDFVKYLILIGCDKNYFKDTFTSSTANNPYIYAKVFRSDFYSKELISSLKPDDYKDTKYAPIYLKHKFYDELFDVIENSENVSFFEKEDKINYLSELLSVLKFDIQELPLIEQNKRIKSIKLLITKGADLGKSSFQKSANLKNAFEKIVFNHVYDIPKDVETFALTFGNPNKKYFIKERNTNWTPLFGAITTKNIEAVDILLKKSADIYYMDEKGVNAFYLAVYSGQITMAEKLILVGYKPNLEPKSIKHPLAISVLNNDIKMLEYLQTLGYDIKKELFGKKNLLEFAITNPNKDIDRENQPLIINFEMYKYLIDNFKNELNNSKNKNGNTPLHQFVENYILIQNQQNDKEKKIHSDVNSILMIAGMVQKEMKQEYLKQLKQSIKYLIDNGSNNKMKNKQNKRAYDIAIDGKINDKELLGWLKR
jgi:ankyrin repeat protein